MPAPGGGRVRGRALPLAEDPSGRGRGEGPAAGRVPWAARATAGSKAGSPAARGRAGPGEKGFRARAKLHSVEKGCGRGRGGRDPLPEL